MYTKLEYSDFLNEVCNNFEKTLDCDLKLYKGISSKEELFDYYYVDPAKTIRQSKTSKENGNFYNLLLNNLPKWNSICKRENSVICTTKLETAKIYGQASSGKGLIFGKTYVVLPKMGSLVAIAPTHDIWYSFQKALGGFGLRGSNNSLVKFNLCITEIFKSLKLSDWSNMNWNDFKTTIEKISRKELISSEKISIEAQVFLSTIIAKQEDVLGFMDSSFEPAQNGIVVKDYNEFLKYSDYLNNEIWTESPCLLIEINKYKLLGKSINVKERFLGIYRRIRAYKR